ncbi:MAG: hypothetical protein AAF560_09700 [Acidobacteriota bacterium]
MTDPTLDACVAEIVDAFHGEIAQARFRSETHDHLERTIRYAIGYALRCGYGDDEDWWDTMGRSYWQGRARQLASLLEDRHTGNINCKQLQEGINDVADRFKNVVLRFQRRRQADSTANEEPEPLLARCPWFPNLP